MYSLIDFFQLLKFYLLAKSNFYTHLALDECYFWTLCYRILWMKKKQKNSDNRSITYKCRLAHIHFTTRAILVKLLLWEPKHLTGVYIPEESTGHIDRPAIYLFTYSMWLPAPQELLCPSFPSERIRRWAQAPLSAGPYLALRRRCSAR